MRSTYDSLNRLTSVDYGNGLLISYSYDESGNRLTRTVTSPYRLVAVEVPAGGGTVTGGGIASVGDLITLRLSPAPGYRVEALREGGASLGLDGGSSYSFTVSDSRAFQAFFSRLDPFDAFVTGFGLDPAEDGGPLVSPSGDGIPNLTKFLLGGDPTVPDTAILPAAALVRSDGGLCLVFGFSYSAEAARSVSFGVEYSSDLSDWRTAVSGQDGVTVETAPVDAATSRMTVTIPFGAGGVFARLRVDRAAAPTVP